MNTIILGPGYFFDMNFIITVHLIKMNRWEKLFRNYDFYFDIFVKKDISEFGGVGFSLVCVASHSVANGVRVRFHIRFSINEKVFSA